MQALEAKAGDVVARSAQLKQAVATAAAKVEAVRRVSEQAVAMRKSQTDLARRERDDQLRRLRRNVRRLWAEKRRPRTERTAFLR